MLPPGQLAEHCAHGDAGVADAGQAAHPLRVNSDPLFGHGGKVLRRSLITAAAGPMRDDIVGIGAHRRASGPFQALIE